MKLFTNITERMSTKNNSTMNTIYKLLVVFTIFIFSSRSYSQGNADPGIGILMVPATVTQGDTGSLSAGVGNYGNGTIVTNSLRVTISVGSDAEIIGIAPGSDPRWTLLTLSSGSGNTIRLKNTNGGFGSFDVGYIILTVRGNVVSGPDLIFGNIVYISANNPLLCGVCPPIPLNVSQGNASTTNDNSQTSLAVTAQVIDAVADTFPSQTPSTTVPTTVGNVTANDTLNGVPVTDSNTDVTPVTAGPISIDATGVVTLAPNTPSGSYPITYTICEVNPVTGVAVSPANCDSVTITVVVLSTIDAVADTFPSQTPSTTVPTTVGNVTANDTLNGVPVTDSNTDVTPVTAGPISIDATGVVTLAPNTPSGSYPITYTICEVNPVTGVAVSPANCDSVTITVVVLSTIDAVADTFPSQTPSTTVPTTVGNVTANDTLNGVPVTDSNTDVTPVTAGPISIDATGVVTLAPNTPSGSYPITYTICEVNPVTGVAVSPANCDSVTITVVVLSTIDAVADTFPSQTPSTTVPTTVGNVTANDTLNGVPVTDSNTDVTPVTAGPISIDATGVVTLAPNTPSGSYPITYTICEVNPVTGVAVSPANCDSVTITVVVLSTIDAVADTFPSQTPSTTVPTTVGNVTANDTLNGVPVTDSNTDVTPVTAGPISIDATGVVTLAPNTPSGSYPITYTICEVNPVTGVAVSPANCDSVTITVVVLSTIDAVADTFPSQTPGTTVPTTVGNVTANDTLNGVPVTDSNTDVTPVTAGPISIDATGVVTLAPNTPSGSYPITYTICEVNPVTGVAVSPANCDSVTITVVVLSTIDAVTETTPAINGHLGGFTASLTNNDTLNGHSVTVGTGGNVTISAVSVPTGLTLNTTTGIVTVAPNTPAGTYPITYTICEVNPVTGVAVSPANCDTVTSNIVVFVTDFTPTIDIDNVVFSTPGVTRDFVVNISEIESSASVGQIVFKIPKQQAFAITFDSTATTSDVGGGTMVNNNDWIITENSLFITVTLKPTVVIDASTFSSVGFKISRKINVPNQTWQPITATIVTASGSDSVNDNNVYTVLVKAQ